MKTVAFLVLSPFRASDYANDSFDGLKPFAEYLLKDALKRQGVEVGFCSVDSAAKFDVILVSLRSIPQYYAFLKAALPKWRKKRRFRVIVGGQGLAHPAPLWEIADYFWYGRAEQHIGQIVEDIEGTPRDHWLETGEIRPVTICKTPALYPHQLAIPPDRTWQEALIGCPNKCYYCWSTWKHRNIKVYDSAYINDISKERKHGMCIEVDMRHYDAYTGQHPMLMMGLDGWTERLRFSINRRVSDEMVIDAILHCDRVHNFHGLSIKLFNVINLEGAAVARDSAEFKEKILKKVLTKLTKPLTLKIHHTPFEPEPCTPLMFAACRASNTTQRFLRNQSHLLREGKMNCFHHRGILGGAGLVENVAILRFSEQYRTLVYMVALTGQYRSMTAMKKLLTLKQHWDLTDLTRRYDVEEKPPCWFIEGLVPFKGLQKLRRQQLRQYGDLINGNVTD